MRLFDRELQRRGAAERTRRAYGVDLGQLALWSSANGVEPSGVDYRRAAALRRPARRPWRRAAHRRPQACGDPLVLHVDGRARRDDREPRGPAAAPEQPQRLPRTLKADEVAALLNRIPATTPLELRDRAMFELAYACGLRAEELVQPGS